MKNSVTVLMFLFVAQAEAFEKAKKTTSDEPKVRTPREPEGATLTLTPTKGVFKLSADAVEKLGLSAGDYVKLIPGTDENGNKLFAIAKGNENHSKVQFVKITERVKDADGNKVIDEKGNVVEQSVDSKRMIFSQAIAYKSMNTLTEKGIVVYSLDTYDADNDCYVLSVKSTKLVTTKAKVKEVATSTNEPVADVTVTKEVEQD